MARPTLAIYGGSFNPPANHHLADAWISTNYYPMTYIVPCGDRADKRGTNATPVNHRENMVRLAFAGIPGTAIILDDLRRKMFTPAYELEQRYAALGHTVIHIIGSDLIRGGAKRNAQIFGWFRGPEVWETLRFGVIQIQGEPFDMKDLPPHGMLLGVNPSASSTDIRARVARGEPIGTLVPPDVAVYIAAHGLYRS